MANPKTTPDHHDADLVLRLYDMRRETVMRQSREAIVKFQPRSAEDVMALAQWDHPQNVAWRQVTSYFEMAYSFARHGVANPDFLAENNGEGLYLFAKIQPYLAELRKQFPLAFKNAEWLTQHSDSARERVEMFQRQIAAKLEA